MKPPLSSSGARAAWASYRCDPDAMTTWRPHGSPWLVLSPAAALPVWHAYNAILARYGYTFDEVAGGTYNCRTIAGTNIWSTHAYGIAIDINPSRNPRRTPLTTDMPPQMILDLEAIDAGGRQALQWGGRWTFPDPMHHQVGCTPAEIAAGVTYPGSEDDMPDIPCLYADGMAEYRGTPGRPLFREVVRRFQYWLAAIGVDIGDDGPDGRYGDDTAAAVLAFASAENLTHPDSGAPYDGKIIDATVEARLRRRYLETITPMAATLATTTAVVDRTFIDKDGKLQRGQIRVVRTADLT